MNHLHRSATAIGIALSAFASFQADGATITWTGSAGDRAASVQFRTVGTGLEVTLTNTSNADVTEPVGLLTAVFFNIGGSSVSLTPGSAVVAAGSVVYFGPTDPGGVVGGEWAYRNSPLGAYNAGISSSGYGVFGPPDLFPGSNLQGPASPGGMEYGITSAGDNPATGNTPVTGTNALIKNSVVFTLNGLAAGFDVGRINAVRFQYGTDLSEPHVDGNVPAPGPAALALLAGVFAAGRRRRTNR